MSTESPVRRVVTVPKRVVVKEPPKVPVPSKEEVTG